MSIHQDVPRELKPVIRRQFNNITGEFEWTAFPRYRAGWIRSMTPFATMMAAHRHADKLNKAERERNQS